MNRGEMREWFIRNLIEVMKHLQQVIKHKYAFPVVRWSV